MTVAVPFCRSRGRRSDGEERDHGRSDLGHARADHLDPVVRRDDLAGEGRRPEPHVVQVDEPPALRQPGLQALPHAPRRLELGQDDVGELGLGDQPSRQRRPERDPRARPSGRDERRQSGRLEHRLPCIGQLAPTEVRCAGRSGEHETPSLAGGRRSRRRDGGHDPCRRRPSPGLRLGRGIHVC